MAKRKTATKKPGSRSRRTDSAPPRSARKDGWTNLLTGLGGAKDKRRSSTFERASRIGDKQLAALYSSNGIARRIVDLPADDTSRNWFEITNDEEDKAKQKLEDLSAQMQLNHADKMARLYGGAIVVMGIDDGQEMTEPVKEDQIQKVDYLTVFDRRDVTLQADQIEKDITTGIFGQPNEYTVISRFGGEPFKVHASRVLRFDGAPLAWTEQLKNAYWMDSVLEAAYEPVRQLGAVFDSSEFITEDFIQTVIKVKNLLDLIARGDDDFVKQRLNLMDMSRHVANTLLIDSEEEYTKHSSTVAGLALLLDRFMMAVSAATGIPVTLLMGRSPAGQNATGEADVRFYYDKIRSRQRNELAPIVKKLLRYIFKSKELGAKEPDSWSLAFNPLQEPTAEEEGQLYKATAEGDAIYIQNQVVDSLKIGEYRFAGDHFNFNPPTLDAKEFEEEEIEDPPALPPSFPAPGFPPPVPPPGIVPPADDVVPPAAAE